MGHFARHVSRNASRDALHTLKKQGRKEQRFAEFMSARWNDVLRRFPAHRFYAGTILPEQVAQIRAEGVKKLIAVERNEQQPDGRWIEVKALKEVARDEHGELFAFYADVGMNQTVPVKINAGFTVVAWTTAPKAVVTPEDTGVKLIAAPGQ